MHTTTMNPSNSPSRIPGDLRRLQTAGSAGEPSLEQYQHRHQQQQGLLSPQTQLLEQLLLRQQAMSLREAALAHQHSSYAVAPSALLQPQHLHTSNLLQPNAALYSSQQPSDDVAFSLERARMEEAIRRGGGALEEAFLLEQLLRSTPSAASNANSLLQQHQLSLSRLAALQRLGYGGGGTIPSTSEALSSSQLKLDSATNLDTSLRLLGKRSDSEQLELERECKRFRTLTGVLPTTPMGAVGPTTRSGFPLPRKNDAGKLKAGDHKNAPSKTAGSIRKHHPVATLASYRNLWNRLDRTMISMKTEVFRRRVCQGTVSVAASDSRSVMLLSRNQKQQEQQLSG